ncbi:ABC transporter ATP-binding protein [Clostridium oryzae]|uniref:ABC-type transporter ATP-binding protein EcsA n=1 Tax=Clostridium oryzae TaxID=1450648 RepID=A0A1V4IC69_9CLOT|nr:ABC transporter ATP-binding protein [Clostridium oryzae]OPJ57602.1 ABC-type transporter ATP-binding protein EcsA [Clostridium oryzae]
MDTILTVKQLKKSYGKISVLQDVSFELKRGRILGLLGRNGAGKTTLLKSILGLNCNYDGNIIFEGKLLTPEDEIMKSKIGSLVEVNFFEDLTAYDNLKLSMMITRGFNMNEAKSTIEKLLEFVDLKNVKKKKVKTFSFGMKQRLALAQAFIIEPDLLILDEPFVGLDPIGIEDTKEILKRLCKENNTSIIFSSHQMEEVKDLAQDIIVLSEGRIKYSDSYENIKKCSISLLDLMR